MTDPIETSVATTLLATKRLPPLKNVPPIVTPVAPKPILIALNARKMLRMLESRGKPGTATMLPLILTTETMGIETSLENVMPGISSGVQEMAPTVTMKARQMMIFLPTSKYDNGAVMIFSNVDWYKKAKRDGVFAIGLCR